MGSPPQKKALLTHDDVIEFFKKESTINCIVASLVIVFIIHQTCSLYGQRKKKNIQIEEQEGEKERRKERIERGINVNLDSIDQALELPPVPHIPYHSLKLSDEDSLRASQLFYERMKMRRSICKFKDQAVPFKIIQNIIKTAGTAPSLANVQPWTFSTICDERMKFEIRHVLESNEKKYYAEKAGVDWVKRLDKLEHHWEKPHVSEAPILIVVLKHVFERDVNGIPRPVYGADVSTSIAVGIMLTAIQNAGLVTVTSGARRCDDQIRRLLKRPDNERVAFVLPIGYPADDATVPDLKRKPIEEIVKLY